MANELKVKHGLVVEGASQITGSLIVTNGLTGSLAGTASYAVTANNALTLGGASAASFATTGSNTFNGTQVFNGNLTINGTASINYLNVVYESASVIYSSGSNQFGDATNDTQILIGSVRVSGSMALTGSLVVTQGITANLTGTASSATTASYVAGVNVDGAVSDSNRLNNQAASYYLNASNINAGTLSNAYLPSAINVTSVTASFKGNLAGTASWATNATSATNATTANNATNVAVTDDQSGGTTYYIAMVGGNSGNQGITVDSSTFTYVPQTDTLTVNNLVGTASQALTASLAVTASYALDAKQLGGQSPSYYTNASNINAGTLGNAYLPSAINVTSATASFRGNLTGTASYASQALTASLANTASYVNILNQNVIVNGSIAASSQTINNISKTTADLLSASPSQTLTIVSLNTAATYIHAFFIKYAIVDYDATQTPGGPQNMRAGNLVVITDVADGGSKANITEATTQDIGDTSLVDFDAVVAGTTVAIRMINSSAYNYDVYYEYSYF